MVEETAPEPTITTQTRDKNETVVFYPESGEVVRVNTSDPNFISHKLIAFHDPESERFIRFRIFWGYTFHRAAQKNPASTALVHELATGNLVQHPYFPNLFEDRVNPQTFTTNNGDQFRVWPLLEMTESGELKPYISGLFVSQVVAAAEFDERVLIAPNVVTIAGQEFLDGYRVGFMQEKNAAPLLNIDFTGYDPDQLTQKAITEVIDPQKKRVESPEYDEAGDPDAPF